jgi:site-specific DNA-adenine methylase
MSFGGRFFGVYAHKYLNGKKEDFCKEMKHSLQRTAPHLAKPHVRLTLGSYEQLHPRRKLIYCDPPYAQRTYPIKYRRDTKRYDEFDTAAFWERMRQWSRTNLVVISETSAPADFVAVWEMRRYRSASQSRKTRFHAKPGRRKSASATHQVEKLFMHRSLCGGHECGAGDAGGGDVG